MARAEVAVVTAADLLERAAAVLYRGWCQRELARDARGKKVMPEAPEACAWCMAGAIFRARYELGVQTDSGPLLRLARAVVGYPLSEWNDAQTDAAVVIAALERAARLAREGEAADARR